MICAPVSNEDKLSQTGDVFLIKAPKNGVTDLVKIMKYFSLDIPMVQLLSLSKELPCMLINGISHAKAIKLMKKVGQPDIFEFQEKGH